MPRVAAHGCGADAGEQEPIIDVRGDPHLVDVVAAGDQLDVAANNVAETGAGHQLARSPTAPGDRSRAPLPRATPRARYRRAALRPRGTDAARSRSCTRARRGPARGRRGGRRAPTTPSRLGADLQLLERDVAVHLRLLRQPEHAFADDVALHLVGAAGDAGRGSGQDPERPPGLPVLPRQTAGTGEAMPRSDERRARRAPAAWRSSPRVPVPCPPSTAARVRCPM